MFTFGKKSKEKLLGVHKDTQELARLALKYTDVDFAVIDGFRTADEQRVMFATGKSELDGVNGVSDHQIGKALDVIPYVKGIDIWDVNDADTAKAWLEVYRAFMRAGMKLGLALEFGLGYNIGGGRDYPHISIVGAVN